MNPINTCTICLETFPQETVFTDKKFSWEEVESQKNETNITPIKTKCNHVFHESCIHQWILEFQSKTTKPYCPMCKTDLINTPKVQMEPMPNRVLSISEDVNLNIDVLNPSFVLITIQFNSVPPSDGADFLDLLNFVSRFTTSILFRNNH